MRSAQVMRSCAGLHTVSWQGLDRSKLCANADRRADLCVSLEGPAGVKADGLEGPVEAAVFGLMYLTAAFHVCANPWPVYFACKAPSEPLPRVERHPSQESRQP